jgi:hypothetical protein
MKTIIFLITLVALISCSRDKSQFFKIEVLSGGQVVKEYISNDVGYGASYVYFDDYNDNSNECIILYNNVVITPIDK